MDTTPAPKRMEPLWDRVDANRLRLFLHLTAFVALGALGLDFLVAIVVGTSVLVIRDPEYWIWLPANFMAVLGWSTAVGAAVAAAYVARRLVTPERYILKSLGAEFVPKGEELETKFALKDMANAAGFKVAPVLYVIETPNVNAFVLGRTHRRGTVGVTRGFIDRLTTDEKRAVFSNLVVRLRAGDTTWATAMSAVLGPLSALRDASVRKDPVGGAARFLAESERVTARPGYTGPRGGTAGLLVWLVLFNVAFVVVSELIASGLRATQLKHAEKADAEGMLLLRDPTAALSALQAIVRTNNQVPRAGAGFAYLFYSWPADGSTDDEDDPERARVRRLREVLGVEGATWRDPMELTPLTLEERAALGYFVAPPAPRLEEGGHDE